MGSADTGYVIAAAFAADSDTADVADVADADAVESGSVYGLASVESYCRKHHLLKCAVAVVGRWKMLQLPPPLLLMQLTLRRLRTRMQR
jgi:hypothetical protein